MERHRLSRCGVLSFTRSKKARLYVLTYDLPALSVCRVPRDPQPDWVLEFRRAVGDRIRARRVQQSRTQWWVCEATGIDRTTYQLIESGQSDPRLGDLALIAHALDVPPADLVDTQRE